MKKLIAILAAVGLTATGSLGVIACGPPVAKTVDLNEIFKSVEGQFLITGDDEDSPEGLPLPIYILMWWPKLEEFLNNESSEAVPSWNDIQKLISDNKNDWDTYVKSWLKKGSMKITVQGEEETEVSIKGFDENLKKNIQTSLDILTDKEIILTGLETMKEIRIYSENTTKFTTEYTYKLENNNYKNLNPKHKNK